MKKLIIKYYTGDTQWFVFDETGRHLVCWVGLDSKDEAIQWAKEFYPDAEVTIVEGD